jgi:hypothetical protein
MYVTAIQEKNGENEILSVLSCCLRRQDKIDKTDKIKGCCKGQPAAASSIIRGALQFRVHGRKI